MHQDLPLTPAQGQALYVQGLTALRDGRLAEAQPLLEQAVCLMPGDLGRRRNLIRALLAAARFEAIMPHLQVALALDAGDVELHFAHGTTLSALGQPSQARAAFGRALSLQPGHAPSWLNLGNASADLDDLAAAEAFCRKAISLDPNLVEAHASLGYALLRQNRLGEARDATEAALRLRPAFTPAQWNRATILLLGGDLRNGFAAYECRKHHARFQHDFPALPGPEWDGGTPAGRTILVRGEQGCGDAIQFARYLTLIHQAGGHAVLLCAPALLRLMSGLDGVTALPPGAALPAYDAWIDQASLPLRFGTGPHNIPFPDGYLAADPALTASWRKILHAGRKIGLVFAGNRNHSGDRHRSIDPAMLAPLLAIPSLQCINLQHGCEATALGLPDLTPSLPDYAETAALITALDAVVTVDTSVAHLAGALGKPTHIMLPYAPDWRWMLHRADSPWYRSVRLYRQPKPGDWSSVVAEVAHALQRPDHATVPQAVIPEPMQA